MPKISTIGLANKLRGVLTTEWQSAALLAAQIDFPPDALHRRAAKGPKHGSASTLNSAKTALVAQYLYSARWVEKRKSGPCTNEYRIKQPCQPTKT